MPHVILICLLPSGYLCAQSLLFVGVQFLHRRLDIAGNKIRHYLHRFIGQLVDQQAIVA
jgi:hypothetical protein